MPTGLPGPSSMKSISGSRIRTGLPSFIAYFSLMPPSNDLFGRNTVAFFAEGRTIRHRHRNDEVLKAFVRRYASSSSIGAYTRSVKAVKARVPRRSEPTPDNPLKLLRGHTGVRGHDTLRYSFFGRMPARLSCRPRESP